VNLVADFTVSKHVNGRDWFAEAQLGTRFEKRDWAKTTSTKKKAVKAAKGKAQKLANRIGDDAVVEVFTESGKRSVHRVSPR